MEQTGAIILAAGLSSRMGKFKPMLTINNTSFIKYIIDKIRKAGVTTIVIVTGYHAEAMEEHLKQSNVILIHNERYASTQMLDSIRIGLRYLQGKCDNVLITPADIPLVAVETYRQVLSQEADFVRPVFKEQAGHPVLLKQKMIPFILNYNGAGGLRGAVEASSCSICNLPVKDPAITMDADTPEDYSRLLEYNNKMIRVL